MVGEIFPRYDRELVTLALQDTRIVLVVGARQVGKSTLTQDIAQTDHPAQSLTLDDKTTRDAANGDPTGFVAGLSGPVLIDEVQRSPDLLLAIKEAVDADQTPGRFLLTGSANILTAPKLYEALSGRIEIIDLWPLAQAEIERAPGNLVDRLFAADAPPIAGATVGRDAFIERAIRGGYPEARLRSQRRRVRWFDSYRKTLIERDLRELADAQKLDEIPKLLRLIAAQAANLYRAENIASKMTLDKKTVQTYTTLLETVFLVKRVKAWRPSIGNREIQTPKIFISDSGLLAYLLGADSKGAVEDDRVTGKLFENFVSMEIARLVEWAEVSTEQYHYRNRDEEVDVVLEARTGDIACVECKAAATLRASDYRPMEKLRDARGKQFVAGFVLYTGSDTKPLGDRLWAVPISALWS
jgi:predicted AAA+ superfamily ATPase